MKIMVTGNLGYVGPPLISQLRHSYPDSTIVGMDLGIFSHCLTGGQVFPETNIDHQIYKDVREVNQSDLKGFSAVVHLAAISNDPMGNFFEKITHEINFLSSIRIAEMAKLAGVKNFVFASSCSVYGEASNTAKKETDELNPLTAYAKSKIDTEQKVANFACDDFIITCLRFGTACGFSARTRLDLVVNDFVAGAIANGVINILSDGSPWRPLIHVADMARAIDWGVSREMDNGGAMLVVNTGCNEWNYQVKDLAVAVANEIPNTNIEINLKAPPDKRSYRVDFTKFKKLAPEHQPRVSLKETVRGLRDGLKGMGFSDTNFRKSGLMRLNILNGHIKAGRMSENLKWI